MFLENSALEQFVLRFLDANINWNVTRTIQVTAMKQKGSEVTVAYRDINNNKPASINVSIANFA